MKNWNTIVFASLLLISSFCFAQFNIVIDAEKDEFYSTLTGPENGFIYIPYRAFNDNGPMPDDDIDLSAYFWCAWDETYFYAYEEVTDDVVNQNNATNYQNDCLEIKIDPDPLQEPTTGVFAIRLSSLDSADADEVAGVDNMRSDMNDPLIYDASNYARKESFNGYILELRIPWDRITIEGRGVSVGVGNIFGMAIMNHDNDDVTRDGSIEWAAVMLDAVWNNPQLHGTVQFLEGNKLQLIAENTITGVANDSAAAWYTPTVTGVSDDRLDALPETFRLEQNFPNPFNPSTTISYNLVNPEQVSLAVFSVAGQEIASWLNNQNQPAGEHRVDWNGRDASGKEIASGVYLYRLKTATVVETRKMMLMR